MKYLIFLHSVVRKRRTLGNVRMTNDPFESNLDDSNPSLENFPESQYFDEDSTSNNTSLIEKDDSTQYMNYEYLNEYFNETDIRTDIPIVEEPFESLSNFSSENILHGQQTSSSTLNISINISQYITQYNTCTSQRPTTPNTSTPHRPTTPNTSTPDRPTTPNTFISHRSTTPNTSISHRSTTPNTSTPRTGQKRKQPSDVDTQLTSAIDAFKNYVTYRNTANAENDSLKNFCDSLYGDLKNIHKKDLIACKIEIMQIISKYTQ